MYRYALILLIVFASVLGLFAGFNLVVDPYDVAGVGDIRGLNARRTHIHDDGGRIHVADMMARGAATSFVMGSSRTVDGFVRNPEGWPGGMINGGFRGSNVFEQSLAMALAARDPDLRCLVIGIDLDEFGAHSKSKSSFAISAFADGNSAMALARMAMSPNTFAASVLTVADNISGTDAETPWAEVYPAGEQRRRYESGARGIYAYYLGYRFDAERLDYFNETLDALTASGVQVVGFIHPLHAWREEALFRAGRGEDYFAFRAALTELFDRYADRQPNAPCVEGGASPLWDFSGFQSFATNTAPAPQATMAHETFYEPSHYLPQIGQAMLDRMRGADGTNTLHGGAFGVRLTPDTLASSAEVIRTRRDDWLASEAGREATEFLDTVIAAQPAAEIQPPQFLNRDDWRDLRRALARLPDRGEAG